MVRAWEWDLLDIRKGRIGEVDANEVRGQSSTDTEALGRWAAPLPYATGAHYFWNSGTSLQKSHKGLLQTLLYDIFRQYPSTMQFSVQHQRWDLAHSHHEQASAEPWAIPELTETLQRLTVQQSLPMRICLFVDGLDEFEGETVDMEELCEILEALAQSPYVKLVVSSRPWNVFEHHFGQDELKKLYTHHLTEQDILTFATARLESHPRWKATLTTTTANSPHQGTPSYLISRICERACGVFLWVRLVTQSLRNGLTNNDTMNDLERRLDSLPADLERLFEHIIKQIDPFYHQLSAEYLLLASNAPEPLKVEAFHFYNQELKDGPGYALDCPVAYRNWRIWGYDVLCNINAYSGGLLEAPDGVTVQFLHRTVHDFLQTQNTSNLLKSKIRPGFDVFASLARAYLVSVKTLQKKIPSLDEEGNIKITGKRPYEYEGEVCSALRGALLAVSKTQPHQQGDGRLLLDELEWAFTTNSFSVTTFGVDADDRDMDMDLFCIFRDHLVRYNLAWYLELKLAESKTLDYFKPFKRIGYSPLFAALDNSVEVVDLLLQYGEDINICKETDSFSSKALSPWTHFCHHVFRETRPRLSTRVVGMMQSLLRQSPNTSEIMNPRDNKPKRVTIFTAFLEWMWENAVDEWSLVMLQKALGSFLDAGAEFGTQELRVMFGDLRGDTVLKKERERRAYMEMVKYVIDKCKSRDDILIEIKRRMPRRLPSHRSQPLITLIDAHLAALSDRKSTERGRDGDVEMIESTEE